MKKILVITTCLFLAFCITMCKKSNSANNATCTTCGSTPLSHAYDSLGTFYYLPTAFTPNGDGINDVFMVFFNNLDTDSSHITIWNAAGTEVFTGKITQRWDGTSLTGGRCSPGQYPLSATLKTKAGATTTACACVTILAYSGSCINTAGVKYYFPDQIDSAGFAFPTSETICP